MSADPLATGLWGEDQAARYLRAKGFKILGQRVRFGPRAELDLVARAGDVLVFVEVKTRAGERFGRPGAAVGRPKRDALSRAAVHYLRALKFPRIYHRFDVVEVVGVPGGPAPEIRHIEHAFTLSPRYQLPN